MADANPKKAPGTGRGSGRKPGSKNLMKAEVKESIGQFFENLTVRNMRWRLDVAKQMQLKTATDPREFRFWSELGLHYFHGTPAKAQPETAERLSLVFIGRNGRPGEYDPMAAQEREFILAQEAREKLELAEKNAVDAELVPAEKDPEPQMEVVVPPDEFGGSRR